MGGRAPDSTDCGQNIDVYSIEYTFADGTKAFCGFRRMNHTPQPTSPPTSTARSAPPSSRATSTRRPSTCSRTSGSTRTTSPGRPTDDAVSPWQYEWNDFIDSIRNDRPHNECKRAVYSDLTTLMGRAACHTGQTVTWDEMMKSNFQFCDYLDKLDSDSPAPVQADENGQFPVPIPGAWKEV